ncbi:bifunctional D-glycero-beta-D-manno-heptose-7-phosphate kinase/D-glycero-beta-D-manno-heptose 1-phosphate adenylyltransferase HldE [Glaciecola sp. MF2-115]|uniref:bifunctional D-glycero-beta-D-manno-heptose-7-phosphate kinase/D-glycero-beta-D-manno-heptose 1-phosphate adenylyltransferase HldE n=1 Tax=Glaciecola sp. MF2-115 TaxID=3384827 RepID=UPI0039A169B3
MQIPDFSNAKILIIGDVMLDRYWTGPTSRISPEAPVPIVRVDDSEDRPGGAANVAINAATLGAQVVLMGMTGEDEAAQILTDRLAAMNVRCEFSKVATQDTITKLRIVSRNQQLLRLDFEKSFAKDDKSELIAKFEQEVQKSDLVVLSDYSKGCLSDPQSLISLARKYNKPVVVDPKGSDFGKYHGASLITPNMSEFEGEMGECESEDELFNKAQELKSKCNLEAVLVTRSEKGMSLFQEEAYHLPAHAKEVYDVTGAGDTVISTLACCIAVGLPLERACQFANHAASVVVGKLGTSTVSTTELAIAVNAQVHQGGGVMNAEQLRLAVQQAQHKGERVVMTNGCFDILHSGHVAYLTEAATLGDRLIVAVNTDDSVRKLKGEGRPINNLQRRMAVLAGLSAVDWVVPFSEDTPQSLIANILPDVLVKGGDYQIHEIAGGKEVIANGGEVRVLLFEEGVSTTGIISQIVNADAK